ncbi:hypothetical protein [Aeoliella sp.]|uniref:hypothetical protein n=1 Tax=Aeoliella sp. TaxID=2795800 RepID=UPI003CCC38DA
MDDQEKAAMEFIAQYQRLDNLMTYITQRQFLTGFEINVFPARERREDKAGR